MHFFRYKTDSTSHLDLPKTKTVSLSKGYSSLFLAILTFICLKPLLPFCPDSLFLLINMTGLEYAEKPFNIPM